MRSTGRWSPRGSCATRSDEGVGGRGREVPVDATAESDGYLLEQRFRYTYAEPAPLAGSALMVVPRAVHGGQRRVDHGISVSGSPAVVSSEARLLRQRSRRVAGVGGRRVDPSSPRGPSWNPAGRRGVTPLTKSSRNDTPFAFTPPLQPNETLTEVARELVASGTSDLDLAERACTRAHESLAYEWGVTDVHTSAAEALVMGARAACLLGLPPVMLALCRASDSPFDTYRVISSAKAAPTAGRGCRARWLTNRVSRTSAERKSRSIPLTTAAPSASYLTVAV